MNPTKATKLRRIQADITAFRASHKRASDDLLSLIQRQTALDSQVEVAAAIKADLRRELARLRKARYQLSHR